MDLKSITNTTLTDLKVQSTFDVHKFTQEEFLNSICNYADRLPDMSNAEKLLMFLKTVKQKASMRYDISFDLKVDMTKI